MNKVGSKYPPIVIAEIGINHSGSLKIAKEMVDSAHRAGVKIIKHQTHIAEFEMSKQQKRLYQYINKNIFDIIKECSLSEEDEYELMTYVRKKEGYLLVLLLVEAGQIKKMGYSLL